MDTKTMPVPVITGPTAAGKTDLLFNLYEKGLRFELISADAFQVYRCFDIGTAKPSREIMEKFPHHLVDIVPPDGSYNAGDFVEQAEKAIGEVLQRGNLPLVVGGTSLYIQSLRDGIFNAPPPDNAYRNELRQRAAVEGNELLFEELKNIDPAYAARIHVNDLVRIVRALEIWHTTGMPFSVAHKKLKTEPRYCYNIMVIERERSELYEDIDRRVDKMVEAGWLEEVRGLLGQGLTTTCPAFRAIGYRELAQVLNGENVLEKAVEITARKTRNYAKRQLTWFRGMPEVTFMSHKAIEDILLKSDKVR